jgi:hypothetical protein
MRVTLLREIYGVVPYSLPRIIVLSDKDYRCY